MSMGIGASRTQTSYHHLSKQRYDEGKTMNNDCSTTGLLLNLNVSCEFFERKVIIEEKEVAKESCSLPPIFIRRRETKSSRQAQVVVRRETQMELLTRIYEWSKEEELIPIVAIPIYNKLGIFFSYFNILNLYPICVFYRLLRRFLVSSSFK